MKTAIEPDRIKCPHIVFKARASIFGTVMDDICELDNLECKLVRGAECGIYKKYLEDKDVETR